MTKSRNSKIGIGGIALATAVILSMAPAMAQRPRGPAGPGGGPGPEGPGDRFVGVILHELDLEPAQRDAIRDIVRNARESVPDETRQAMRDARRALAVAMWSADATEADVQAAADRLAALERERLGHRYQVSREVLAQLTPEQQVELATRVEQLPEMREARPMERRERRHRRW